MKRLKARSATRPGPTTLLRLKFVQWPAPRPHACIVLGPSGELIEATIGFGELQVFDGERHVDSLVIGESLDAFSVRERYVKALAKHIADPSTMRPGAPAQGGVS